MSDVDVIPNRLSPGRALGALLRVAELDRAVVLAILSRVWQLAAAPLTLILIARRFSPELQGFYFTFSSLMALQSFIELGFYIVIINVASHEWSSLALDDDRRIVGDPKALDRLVSLGRLIFRWYAAASVVFVVAVGAFGYAFFARSPQPSVHWQGPWLATVGLTGLILWMLPFNSLLEGCNQVAEVNRLRLSQAILGNLALWATILLGGGLWAAAVWAMVNVLRDLYLLLVRYRRFFEPFFRRPDGPGIHWGSEIWPMQWRLALSGVVNYLAFSLYNPVMFRYHGAVVAGRFGMTLAAIYGLQSVAAAMVQTKAPRFGVLVARREFAELDRLFLRVSLAALALLTTGGAAFWLLVFGLNALGHPLAGRLLSPSSCAILLAGGLFHNASVSMSAYLRAHKQEPTMVLNVVSGALIGLLVWLAGGRYGPPGAAASYLGVYVLVVIWEGFIWCRCRAEWHRVTIADPLV